MLLALIGYPLGHSRSPEIYKKFFSNAGVEGEYRLFPMPDISGLGEWLRTVPTLQGFNITIPHKKAIIPFLDEISPEASAIGAVNTVKVRRENGTVHLTGYNTDYAGFKTTLEDFLGGATPTKALILGTGGSSATVAYTLEQLGIDWKKVSRQKQENAITYEEVTREMLAEHRLVINTTPVGMSPDVDAAPALLYEALTQEHYLYDLVYNPTETLFLKKGTEMGAHTRGGWGMLEQQAAKAWEIFNTF